MANKATIGSPWRRASAGPPDSCVLGDAPAHEYMPRRTSVCKKRDMRCPKSDKRSELAVKYRCHGSVHRAKPEFEVWQRYPAQTSGRFAAEDKHSVPSVSNASVHGDGSRWSLSSLPFSPINLDKGPSAAAMVVELPGFASNCPNCRLANLNRWTGEIALPRPWRSRRPCPQ